jgi:cytochrome c peroxidase
MAFHAIGMGDLEGTGVTGYDPTKPEHLGRGGFTGVADDNFKFKVPQLYNLTDSPFLGHGGTFTSVREVVEYKNTARVQRLDVPAGQLAVEFVPLGLSSDELIRRGRFPAHPSRDSPRRQTAKPVSLRGSNR